MIPAGFEYVKAKTLGQALTAAATKDTQVLAGGQSLIPLLRFRLAQPKRLVDIGGLAQLKGIKATPKGLRIGSGVTYRELLDSAQVRKHAPLIAEVTKGIGDRQVRNRGTIGGSVAHADPASDMPAVLLALGATITARSKRGTRSIRCLALLPRRIHHRAQEGRAGDRHPGAAASQGRGHFVRDLRAARLGISARGRGSRRGEAEGRGEPRGARLHRAHRSRIPRGRREPADRNEGHRPRMWPRWRKPRPVGSRPTPTSTPPPTTDCTWPVSRPSVRSRRPSRAPGRGACGLISRGRRRSPPPSRPCGSGCSTPISSRPARPAWRRSKGWTTPTTR